MHIRKSDLAYHIFAFLSFVMSFYTIVIHIGFHFLPVFFLITGVAISFIPSGNGMKLFFFFIPLINSLPAIFSNGYPFNMMATILFFLAGIIIGMVSQKNVIEFGEFNWKNSYLFFLLLLWISAIFVFLRWSNITLSLGAFLKDTPVSPGLSLNPRNSFSIIFPVMTVFLFSMSPFVVSLIRKFEITKEQIFKLLISGYFISVLIATYQKFFNNGFLSLEWWGSKLNQYNGGFSDFNGFGFFGGVIFLYSSLRLMENNHGDEKFFERKDMIFLLFSFSISFIGIILSGSRTAFIFVIFAFIFMLFSKVRILFKIVLPVVVIIVLVFSGGELKKRLDSSLDSSRIKKGENNFLQTLDKFSNGRVQMIRNSLPMILKYPVSGVGVGNFLFYLKYLKHNEKFIEDFPLNQYLLIVDEMGLIGIFVFLFFLISLLKRKKRDYNFKILLVILIVMFVGNSLWLPEIFILFWIIVGALQGDEKRSFKSVKNMKPYVLGVLIVFVFSNIFSFNSLHPSKLMSIRKLSYDYGFWTKSIGSEFIWTKGSAGVLIKSNCDGSLKPLKFFCGAPLDKLPQKSQKLDVFMNGELVGTKIFQFNEEYILRLNGIPEKNYFIEMKINPVFNLKRMLLGEESRNLGIQFFPEADGL